MARLAGKVALISGAGEGIGAGIAELFAEQGARVLVTDLVERRAAAVAARIGASAQALQLDVRSATDWQRAVECAAEQFGGLDILVQSAGVSRPASIEDCSLEDWRDHMLVHGEGALLGCQAVIAAMRARGGGAIVNISSVESIRPGPLFTCYAAAKAAQDAITKTVALHCAESGYKIRCNSLHPAATETPLLRQYLAAADDPVALEKIYAAMQPLNRIATVGEVANSALFLASDEASFVTGHQMLVDGGALTRPYPPGQGA
jgi:3(or 17)beta-hydroxysteroid dehydrogenase